MPDWINNLLWVLIGALIGAVGMSTIVCCWIGKGDRGDDDITVTQHSKI